MIPLRIAYSITAKVDMDKVAGAATWALPLASTLIGTGAGAAIGASSGKAGKGAVLGGLAGLGVGAAGLGVRGLAHTQGWTEAGRNMKRLGMKNKFMTGLKADLSPRFNTKITNVAGRRVMGELGRNNPALTAGKGKAITRMIDQGFSKKEILAELRKDAVSLATRGINPKKIITVGGGLYLGGKYLGKENTKVSI
jgi:hypothetical protein